MMKACKACAAARRHAGHSRRQLTWDVTHGWVSENQERFVAELISRHQPALMTASSPWSQTVERPRSEGPALPALRAGCSGGFSADPHACIRK
eukprot:354442-Chlamydomonas_euryale.AAC.4